MNRNIFFWITLVIAQFLTIVFISRILHETSDRCKELRKEIAIKNNEIKMHDDQFKRQLLSENKFLDNIFLSTVTGDTVEIKSLVSNPKLIYRFPAHSCMDCVNADFSYLKQIGEIIGFQNILIIAQFSNSRELNIFNEQHGKLFSCYNYRGMMDISLESELNNNLPFMFILNKDLEINLTFLTFDFHDLTITYFSRIEQFFKNINRP